MAELLLTASVWAIRHNPSHTYMPLTKMNRGYTSLEVEEFAPFGKTRLFDTPKAATRALNCWLKGPWVKEYDYDDYGSGRYVCGGSPPNVTPSSRPAADMELVEFTITEVR